MAGAGGSEALAEQVRRLESHAINFAYRMTGDATRAEALFVPMLEGAIGALASDRGLEGAFSEFRQALLRREAANDDSAAPGSDVAEEARWLGGLAWPIRERVVLRLYHRLDPALVARITAAASADEVRAELVAALGEIPPGDECPACGVPRAMLIERLAGELAEAPARAADAACESCPEHRALRDRVALRLAALAAHRGLSASPERRARVTAHLAARTAADAYRRALVPTDSPPRRRHRWGLIAAGAFAVVSLALALMRGAPVPVAGPPPSTVEPIPFGESRPPVATAPPVGSGTPDYHGPLEALARAYPPRRCLALRPMDVEWDPVLRVHVDTLLALGASARAALAAAASDSVRGPVAVLVLASGGDAGGRAGELAAIAGRPDAAPDAARIALRALAAGGGHEARLSEVARTAGRETVVRVEAARLVAEVGGSIELLLELATALGQAPADRLAWADALGGDGVAWRTTAELAFADSTASTPRRLAAGRLLAWGGSTAAVEQAIRGEGAGAFRAALLGEHVAREGAKALELVLGLADADPEGRVRARALAALRALGPGLGSEARDGVRHVLLAVVGRPGSETEAAAAFIALGAAGYPAVDLALELERAIVEDGFEARRRGAVRAVATLQLTEMVPVIEAVARGLDGPDRDGALVALGRLGGTSELLADLAAAERRGGAVPAAALGRHLAGMPLARAGLDLARERKAVALALDDPIEPTDLLSPTLGGLCDWLRAAWRIELALGHLDPKRVLADVATEWTARALAEATTGKRIVVVRGGQVALE